VSRAYGRRGLDDGGPAAAGTAIGAAVGAGPAMPLIDDMLRADLSAARKQRHTIRRIFDRLVDEHGVNYVSYTTVREYVNRRRPQIIARIECGSGHLPRAGRRGASPTRAGGTPHPGQRPTSANPVAAANIVTPRRAFMRCAGTRLSRWHLTPIRAPVAGAVLKRGRGSGTAHEPPTLAGMATPECGIPERRVRARPDRTTATAGSSHTSQLAQQTHWNLSSLTRSWVGFCSWLASRAGLG
jgi:hypothetical protein